MGLKFKKKFNADEEVESSVESSTENRASSRREKLKVVEGKPFDLSELESLQGFDLKSEHVEKDVNLVRPTEEEMNQPVHTQVTIYKEDGVQTVDPRDLKDIIKKTKGIKQVVVEKISVSDATRVSLHFEPKEKQISQQPLSQMIESREVKTAAPQSGSLEFKLNQNFLSGKAIKSQVSEEDEQIFSELENEIENIDLIDEGDVKTYSGSRSDEEEVDYRPTLEKRPVDLKKVEYSQHTLTKKKSKIHNGYYYRAKDHVELFKVGSSFLRDFNHGLKSFSFVNKELKEPQQKTVFGVSAFFNYHQGVRAAIITSTLEDTFYQNYVTTYEVKSDQVLDEDLYYRYYATKGFDVVEFSEFDKVERRIKEYDFEFFLESFLDKYDMVLWDLPAVEVLDSNKELYFPIIRILDNVSIIVGGNQTKIQEIHEIIGYFNRYQVKVKGLMFSKESEKKESNKEKK